MAAIAKFISYDGGIAFSDKVVKFQKRGRDSILVPLENVISLGVRAPQPDTDGFIHLRTSTGQRYRIFFEEDQYREALSFKRQFDALSPEPDAAPATAPARSPSPGPAPAGSKRSAPVRAAARQDTGAKERKPLYKRWWFWTAVALLAVGVFAVIVSMPASDTQTDTPPAGSVDVSASAEPETADMTAPTEPADTSAALSATAPAAPAEDSSVPSEYRSALAKAETYSQMMHMSKAGIYDQLTSEYGEGFTAEAAQYAIDNITADWNANALASAESYSDTMHMSKAGIYDQLTSEYGEKFTPEEAQYAIDNIVADWNANALATAISYRDGMDMSPDAIHEQLTSEYGEKFTQEEADYAIANLG